MTMAEVDDLAMRLKNGSEPTLLGLVGVTRKGDLQAVKKEGMMLLATARPPRQSFIEGPSTVRWVAVVAWTVVMRPSTMPNLSLMTLARGARQLVVHDAFEIYAEVRSA